MYFCIGVGFFLVGHIFYNVAMFDLWEGKSGHRIIRRKLLILFGTVFFLSVSFINLTITTSNQSKLKDQKFLIFFVAPVYLIFLTLNCVHSLMLLIADKRVNEYQLLMSIGTWMFLISDNLLGRKVFADFSIFRDQKNVEMLIMATYYLGQYFITLNLSELLLGSA
jgi:hypothetical protein